jgi:hypothetical protein
MAQDIGSAPSVFVHKRGENFRRPFMREFLAASIGNVIGK